jgi:catechol 2,3-dioxygenase-like lactoylglutathione lyase family enzyme
MLAHDTFKVWTAAFAPGSYFEGSWDQGARIKFLTPEGEGMTSMIAVNRPHEFLSIKHLGFINGGVEELDNPRFKAWEPAFENYTFRERDGATEVRVELNVAPEFEKFMQDAWPRALTSLKEICEAATAVAMKVQDSYPVVVTDKLIECRDFYTRQLGFSIVFEASWFVYLASGSERPFGIAFMAPEHPSHPPGPEAFNGKGMFMTLQVADAAAAFEQLKEAGTRIAYALTEEPWGQRRFGLLDPVGMWIDIVQQVEPQAGFWERYPPKG